MCGWCPGLLLPSEASKPASLAGSSGCRRSQKHGWLKIVWKSLFHLRCESPLRVYQPVQLMEKRALLMPLVHRDALAGSGCLGYDSSCRWSACCCYANENISKLPEAAVICLVQNNSKTCVLFICRLMLQGHQRVRTFTWKCDAVNNLWDDAVSNGIYFIFIFNLLSPPSPSYLLILHYLCLFSRLFWCSLSI